MVLLGHSQGCQVVAAAAPAGRLVEVPGGAHLLVSTHPDAVAALLRSA